MLLGCLYLLVEGADRWSIDAVLSGGPVVKPPYAKA
jgi:hypothetical protein